jgi:hypothetical protein
MPLVFEYETALIGARRANKGLHDTPLLGRRGDRASILATVAMPGQCVKKPATNGRRFAIVNRRNRPDYYGRVGPPVDGPTHEPPSERWPFVQ